jgi:predicted GNAT superfamily acetyltransferase
MGATPSKKTQNEQPREVHISMSQVIDPADPTIFPEAVRNELMAVKQEVVPPQLFLVKEFGPSSELVQWLHQCKSYFAYEGENNNNNNYNNNNNNNNRNSRISTQNEGLLPGENALAMRLRRLTPKNKTRNSSVTTANNLLARLTRNIAERDVKQKGGVGVDRDKNPFLSKLDGMCATPNIETKFLANLLEVEDRFLLAFLNTGHIAGFMIFAKDYNEKKCLHRYVTCTGPRKLGIGAALVKEIHAIAKREGHTCVTLGASDSEGFHRKQGYVNTGRNTMEGPEMIYRLPQEGGARKKTRKAKRNRK